MRPGCISVSPYSVYQAHVNVRFKRMPSAATNGRLGVSAICDQVVILQVQSGRFGEDGSELLKISGKVESILND